MIGYVCLFASVLVSVFGTFCGKISEGFTKMVPTIGALVVTVIATGLMAVTVNHMDLGIAYATWSGSCIILTGLLGLLAFKERMGMKKFSGVVLIVMGCIMMNCF